MHMYILENKYAITNGSALVNRFQWSDLNLSSYI